MQNHNPTDRQTNTNNNKTSIQRITQSVCKLISLACKVKDLAGEQEKRKKKLENAEWDRVGEEGR